MWFLKTRTLELEEFPDHRNVNYAILSHRWTGDEVLFRDIMSHRDISRCAGYFKVLRCCKEALERDISYAWVDTCCINKDSSAELQEAINSMYNWYQSAQICFAYLADICDTNSDNIVSSLWFTRGWTLQELIAPCEVEFYNCDWKLFGKRSELAHYMSLATSIPEKVLNGQQRMLSRYSVGERMSWAKGRRTTRVEDRAYSLLGLFDVNMPMLYGEGSKAFLRLQEEIFNKTSDQSILAWEFSAQNTFDVFAPDVDNFPLHSAERKSGYKLNFRRRGHHSITNEGLSLELIITPWKPDIYIGVLNYEAIEWGERLNRIYEGIFLRALDRNNNFVRHHDADDGSIIQTKTTHDLSRFMPNTRRIRATIVCGLVEKLERLSLTHDVCCEFRLYSAQLRQLADCSYRYETKESFQSLGFRSGECGLFDRVKHREAGNHAIKLGFDFDFNPVLIVHRGTTEDTIRGSISPMPEPNVTKVHFTQISAFEPEGWLSLANEHSGQWPIDAYGKLIDFLPLKLGPEGLKIGLWECDVVLPQIEATSGGSSQVVMLRLWRDRSIVPWNLVVIKGYGECGLPGYNCHWHYSLGSRCNIPPQVQVEEISS